MGCIFGKPLSIYIDNSNELCLIMEHYNKEDEMIQENIINERKLDTILVSKDCDYIIIFHDNKQINKLYSPFIHNHIYNYF